MHAGINNLPSHGSNYIIGADGLTTTYDTVTPGVNEIQLIGPCLLCCGQLPRHHLLLHRYRHSADNLEISLGYLKLN